MGYCSSLMKSAFMSLWTSTSISEAKSGCVHSGPCFKAIFLVQQIDDGWIFEVKAYHLCICPSKNIHTFL